MSTRKRIITAIIGLLILAGCAWFLADAMGFEFIQLESSWTFILIAAGFFGLFSGEGILFNLGLMLLGGGILARDNGWLGGLLGGVAVWQMIVAILLLVIGLTVIGSALGLNRRWWKKRSERACTVDCGSDGHRSNHNSSHTPHRSAGGENSVIFGEQRFEYSGREFHGAEVSGIFGSAHFDLRNAVITEDCTVEANAVFGEVEIITGTNANYVIFGNRVVGAVNDHRSLTHTDGLPTVTVNANAVFGSVEII